MHATTDLISFSKMTPSSRSTSLVTTCAPRKRKQLFQNKANNQNKNKQIIIPKVPIYFFIYLSQHATWMSPKFQIITSIKKISHRLHQRKRDQLRTKCVEFVEQI